MKKRQLIVALAFCTAVGVNAETIAHWSFDNDFNDDSPNNNHLTVATGTPTITTTSGEHVFGGGALDADSLVGTQEYLNLTNPITFGASDAWSVAFWGRRRPGTDDRSGMVIGNPGNKFDFIWLSNNPNQVEGLRLRSSSNTNANFDGFPDDGQWHHWAVIADGSGNVAAYRDNVSQGSVAPTSSFSPGTWPSTPKGWFRRCRSTARSSPTHCASVNDSTPSCQGQH